MLIANCCLLGYHVPVLSPAAWATGAIDFTLTGLAGIPTEIVYGGISFVATPSDPSRPCSCTQTPLITVAWYVMRARGPISVLVLVTSMPSFRSCSCE